MCKKANNVFVYGTLKSGYRNHYLLEAYDAVKVSTKEIVYSLRDLGAYPAVFLNGKHCIKGELFTDVSDATMRNIDQLEGYPIFYNKKWIELSNGEFAWMYYLPDDSEYQHCEKMVDGEWLENKSESKHLI